MRTLIKTIAAALIMVTFTFANQRNVDTKKINENFVIGLQHQNEGVVESTIKVVIFMKFAHPNADFDEIIDELEELVMDGANKNIRLKALIATDYLNNFDQYQWVKEQDYSEGDQVFDAYLNQMHFYRMADSN